MRHPLALRARLLRLALVAAVVAAAVGLGSHNVQANDDAYGFDPDELMDEIDPCFFNSPVKAPFLQKLPVPAPAQQAPSDVANTDKYEIHEVRAETEIIPGIKTPVWHYVDATTSPAPFPPDGEVETMLGPTILARRGVPVDVRWVNNLLPNEDPTSIINRSPSDNEHDHSLPSSTALHVHGINADHTSDGFPDFADGHEHRKVPGQAHLFH